MFPHTSALKSGLNTNPKLTISYDVCSFSQGSDSDSDDSSDSSSQSSSDSTAPLYTLRARSSRTLKEQVENFDEMINEAIRVSLVG